MEDYLYVAEKLARLRRNDPSETDAYIRLGRFNDDELSEAFRTNEHVNSIELDLNDLARNSNWDSLLRVIATRETLEKVALWQFESGYDDTDRVTPFLQAIQQNPRVQTVGLRSLHISGDSMASFIDSATTVTTLSIRWCDMLHPGGGLAVAAALQRNSNIRRLELLELVEMHLISILSSLAFNSTVQTLRLRFGFLLLDESLAVGSLLEANRTIERFELILNYRVQVDTFRPIAQSLIQSMTVTDVRFVNCNFDGQNEMLMLNSILESKSNLQWLTLTGCIVHEDGRAEFHAKILSLLQPHSSLRSLELNNYYEDLSYIGFGRARDFARLLTAVETSPLERFALAIIDSRALFLALIGSIPKMQVGTLELMIRHDRILEDMTRDFIQAIKRNASLCTVVVKNSDLDDWFEDDDKLKLLAYSARNAFLDQWMENSNLVPVAALSEYLAVAQTTGPNNVLRILQVLTPSLWNVVGE
jgi:hypothetical protein